MPGVTGVAGALGTVGVDATDASVGPGARIQSAVFVDQHDGTVTLATPYGHSRRAAQRLAQKTICRVDDVSCIRVMTGLLLLSLSSVAPAAIPGRNEDGDGIPVMIHGILIALFGHMALVATNSMGTMTALLPLCHYTGHGF